MRAMYFASILVILTICLSCKSFANQEHAKRMLERQVQLLSLVEGSDEKFAQYSLQLIRTPPSEIIELSQQITEDIKLFWRSKGVKIKHGDRYLNDQQNRLAMGAEPQVTDYLVVSNHIVRLLWMQKNHAWLPLEINGLLRAGGRHPDLPIIEKRLLLLGDLIEPVNNTGWLDEPLVAAIKRFQQRHGLKVDGVVGPMTLHWLNKTPYQRAKLLAKNFVKKASYEADIGSRYLLVNIPAFEMVLVDENEEQLRSRVIVGKPYRQTPVMRSDISNIVLNPSWRVPRKIIYRDLLPQIRKDGAYISNRQFAVFDYQGNPLQKEPEEWQILAAGKFPYRMVQKPGELNALGRYKFHFANRYAVYLHDTPNPELFDSANRALSSGCVRVESVKALANWMASHLVKDQQTWVDMQQTNQETKWFSFKSTLPVHLVYWTAWVDDVNRPQFRNDIYNFEEKENNLENVITRR